MGKLSQFIGYTCVTTSKKPAKRGLLTAYVITYEILVGVEGLKPPTLSV